ncbi:hypothetical protein N9025_01215 [Synechococcus sp. AH-707-B22]|nr:hypothetical protein [Synechococcus sp. AH-707-B22]
MVRFCSILFALALLTTSKSYAEDSKNFNVYCTSNQDATGVCLAENTDQELACIIIPGQIIQCTDREKINYECVLVVQVTPTQAEFSCQEDKLASNNSNEGISSPPLVEVIPNDFENAF